MPSSKRIGFVDHNLENFHSKTYLDIFRNALKHRGYEVTGVTAANPAEGRAWADKYQVPYFASVEELNPHVDFFIVLAPSAPDTHLDLCKQVFPFSKPTFVDKIFAPSLAVAREIFALADRYKTATQTCSALRYTAAQPTARKIGPIQDMVAWVGGGTFQVYGIHPVEMVVSCMGPDAVSLMRRGAGQFTQLLINFANNRTAVANVNTNHQTPMSAMLTGVKESVYVAVDAKTLFVDAAAAILDFFDTGRPSIDRAETLVIRSILDAAELPEALTRFVNLAKP